MHSRISDRDNKVMREDIPLVVFSPPFGTSSGSLSSFYSCRTDDELFVTTWLDVFDCGGCMAFAACYFASFGVSGCQHVHSDFTHSSIFIGDTGRSRATWPEHRSRGFSR